jgi:2-succinyl-5-enolpyruvyl-6-hydroxy-3-cyclohexene-1-carboxylate synthase
MAKSKVITLEEAIELKQTIQELLLSKRNTLKLENCFPINSKRNYDLKKLLKEKKQLSEWFVDLKLEIQKANLVIPEGETHNISYWVYKMSELKSDIITYDSSLKPPYWKEGLHKVDPSADTKIEVGPFFSKKQIENWSADAKKEYYNIEQTLTKLNQLITITINFDPKDLV